MYRSVLILTTIFLTQTIFSAIDLPFNRYYARIKNKNVNVRARSTTSSEIMYELNRGEDILIIGESGEWLKIKPKEGFNAWIHKDMIENGVIAKNNVNIRVGPSLSSSILGRLSEGDPVIIIKTEGEWTEIEMPREFGFWIAKFLVKFLCPGDSYQEYLVKEKMSQTAFTDAEEFRRKELLKRYLDVDHDKIIEMYQSIIDKYPDTPEALKAQERIIDAHEKKAMARQKQLTLKEFRTVIKLFDEAEATKQKLLSSSPSLSEVEELKKQYQHISENYPTTKEGRLSLERLTELDKLQTPQTSPEQTVKIYSEAGKLEPYTGMHYPEATHQLIKGIFNKKTLSAVFSKNIDLRAFEKKHVIISGYYVYEGDSTQIPLIEVKKIFLK